MDIGFPFLRDMVLRSLKEPRAAAEDLFAIDVPREALWTALALVVTLSALSFYGTNALLPAPQPAPDFEGEAIAPILLSRLSPMVVTLMIFVNMVLLVFGLFWTGRALGGAASVSDIVLMLSWLQFLMLVLQVVQAAVMVFAPVLASLLSLAVLFYLFWVFLVFLAVAEGYKSAAKAFLQLLLTLVGISLGIGMILSLIGVTSQGAIPNV